MDELIQWPKAKYWTKQWNPLIGCKPCSPACQNCYAAAWAKRFGQSFEPHYSSQRMAPRSGVVFCGNMTDLFGDWLTEEQINAVVAEAVRKESEAKYLWLTKRPDRMVVALRNGHVPLICKAAPDGDAPEDVVALPFSETASTFRNQHYFGFTAENQYLYDTRMAAICELPDWANWWLSCEPLLEKIDLWLPAKTVKEDGAYFTKKPSWVVVGCESGPGRRSCKIEWVENIVEECKIANVPVFVKQLSINGRCETDINKFPAHLRIRQIPWAKEVDNA